MRQAPALVLDERIDSFAIRRLKGQRDSDRLSAVECRECSIQDQPLDSSAGRVSAETGRPRCERPMIRNRGSAG